MGAGLLLGTIEGAVNFRVVGSLMEAARLLHDARRAYTRILICGVPAAETGSLLSSLTVLQARGSRVWWFDSHDLLWTSAVRAQLDQLGVQVRLPDPSRPETERTAGVVLAHLLDGANPRAGDRAAQLRGALREARAVERGGPDWLALLDAVEHDHRLIANRVIRAAVLRVLDQDAPLNDHERRLVALQRGREARVERFMERLADEGNYDQELLTFDVERYQGLRFIRPRMYTEAARRMMRAAYAQSRVEQGWIFACRDPYRAGIDLQVAFMEQLFDLDVTVHGYPYRATVRTLGGANVDERLTKALETALEEERAGKRKRPLFPDLEEEIDW